MRFNKFISAFCIMTFGWMAMTSAYAVNQGDPVGMLQYIADNMISGLKAHKATIKSNPQEVYNLAYKFVVPYADLPAMSKDVLSPQKWNQASPEQRMSFQREFTTTVIRTYASALTSYQDQTVRFFPVRGGTQGMRTVEVNSQILSSQHDPINVSYRLVRNGSVWRLYDMSVEGVDMLESFREQFADILSNGNMDQLLQRMSSHNNGTET